MRLALTLVCLVALAGCSFAGGPAATPTDSSIRLNVTNADTTAYTVEVGVTTAPVRAVELTYRNGTVVTVPAESAETGVYFLENVTDAEPVGEQVRRRTYDLAPGSGVEGEFAVPRNGSVVFTATTGGEVRTFAYAGCASGSRLYFVEFLVGSYGPAVGLGCTGA